MKFSKTIVILKPAAEVWKVFATDFATASDWMAAVPRSYAKSEGKLVENAIIPGRICHLSSSKTRNMVDENITEFDPDKFVIKIEISPLNMPAIFPFRINRVRVEITDLGDGKSSMRWDLAPELKMGGYLLYPLVKLGLGKGFDNILAELKYFVENGKPHPRKQAKLAA